MLARKCTASAWRPGCARAAGGAYDASPSPNPLLAGFEGTGRAIPQRFFFAGLWGTRPNVD